MTEPEPLKLVVAINPEASFGKGRSVGPHAIELLREAGHKVFDVVEASFELLRETTAKLISSEKPDALIVVGGDGAVSLGVNLVAGTQLPLGLIPSGTGNDMARGLGIPREDTAAAVKHFLDAVSVGARQIDAGIIRGVDGFSRWFSCVFSAGFDAIVNERANQMRWPKGRQRYNLALLRELAMLKPIKYLLEVDGEKSETKALLIAAANNESFGGGMRITPEAKLNDGLLDLFVVQPMSRFAFLRIFPSVFKGTHTRDPRVLIRQVKRVRIDARGIVAYADGERVTALPLEVEVVPNAIRVFA